MWPLKVRRCFLIFRTFLTTLRARFLLGFICLGIVMTVFFFLYFYQFASEQILRQVGESQSIRIKNAVRISDSELSEFNSFLYWLIANGDLEALLNAHDLNSIESIRYKRSFYDSLNNIHLYSHVKQRINLLYITGENGTQIRYGKNAYNMDIDRLRSYDWYKQAEKTNGSIAFYPCIPNFNMVPLISTYQEADEYVTPVFKYLKYGVSSQILGKMVVLVDSNILLSDMSELSDGMIDMCVDSAGNVLAASDFGRVGSNLSAEAYYQTALKNGNGTFTALVNNVQHLVTTCGSANSANLFISIVPVNQITHSVSSIIRSCILSLGIMLIFVFIISFYLSSNFTKPINAVVQRINEISNGVFHHEGLSLQRWNVQEIQFLSGRLIIMEQKLKRLLEAEVQREKEKRNLEIQILQAQISPHFLNNTLSIIRMMAIIQGSQGIADMLENLSTIIAATLQNSSEKITLREELSIVNAYVSIHRIRYHGRIEYELSVADESLLDAMILKFTLQPIIENAIFHGIVPKNQLGHIRLTVTQKEQDIEIAVSDDGVGFSEEKKKCILNKSIIGQDGVLHGIGLSNVNKRLKLVYGAKYGISFPESDEDTIIVILLPTEKQPRKEATHESFDG